MEQPKLINNISERVVDDLKGRLSKGACVSIAAASFSIYAYEALKEELEQVEQLRFIFTSPTFIKDKSKKEKRVVTESHCQRMCRLDSQKSAIPFQCFARTDGWIYAHQQRHPAGLYSIQ